MAGSPPPQGNPYPPPPGGPQYQGYQQPPTGPGAPPPGYDQNAPFGVDPKTGIPYSDKQKLVTGLLQLLPIIVGIGGIGRLYSGHTGTGIAQLLLSCIVVGGIWSIIDGILILVNDSPTDSEGRVLKPN